MLLIFLVVVRAAWASRGEGAKKRAGSRERRGGCIGRSREREGSRASRREEREEEGECYVPPPPPGPPLSDPRSWQSCDPAPFKPAHLAAPPPSLPDQPEEGGEEYNMSYAQYRQPGARGSIYV